MANVAISMGIGIGVNLLVGLLSPRKTQTIEGSRIEDLDVPKASVGSNIPIPLGVVRYNACPIFWSPPIVEVRRERRRGGKGGPPVQKEVNYNYFGNFAALVCGSPTDNGIQAITRIWLNGDLYWNSGTDITGQNRDLNSGSQESSDIRLSAHMELYLGTATQQPSPTIQSLESGDVPAFRHRVYIVFRDLPLASFGNRIPKVDVEVLERQDLKVSQIVRYLCGSVGMVENTDFSIRNLDIPINGYSFKRSGDSARSAIEELQQTYLFLGRDKGSKIEFFPFANSSSLLSVTTAQLGRSGQGNQFYKQEKTPTIDIPSKVEIKAKNILQNHDPILKRASKSSKTHDNTLSLDTSIVTEPQRLADASLKLLEYLWLKQEKFTEVVLPAFNTGTLSAGDRVTILLENKIVEIFIQTSKVGANYEIEIEGVLWNSDIGSITAPTQPINYDDDWQLPSVAEEPDVVAFDLPLIRDEDSDIGVYVGADIADDWVSGTLYVRQDEDEFDAIGEIVYDIGSGTIPEPTPIASQYVVDRVTKIDIIPDGESLQILSPCSEQQLLAYKNLALIGRELIAFKDVTLLSDGRYRLSNLIRGCRGTESAITSHTRDEKFYLIKDVGFERIPGFPNDIGTVIFFAAIGEGGSILEVTQETSVAVVGESAKTYAPVNPRLTRNLVNGTNILEWDRRTRRNGNWRDSVDVELGETSEQYEIVINGNSNIIGSPSFTFSSNQDTVSGIIYQLSATVGRGKPLSFTNLRASRIIS